MSFSREIKKELAGVSGNGRHCQLAELAALLAFEGKLTIRQGELSLRLDTENELVKERSRKLREQLFGISHRREELAQDETERILSALCIWDPKQAILQDPRQVDGRLLERDCCKRAYIRGAFLAVGSMSDPQKGYHLEFVCSEPEQALQLQQVMDAFELDARIIQRKKSHVVYLKEGEHIVDCLNVMGAHHSLMDLENVRIVKEMRNSVNRQVNCETANISKTVNAAVRQIAAIEYIRDHRGLDALPEKLREIALVRLEYQDISLQELGEKLSEPLGKSGVNHRLRKLIRMAEDMGMEEM